ncbi:MAG: hypothetical protein QME74_07825 [Candidatus Edwardsbacteria bacterium]|nr:hypothetical protein [Candidatus Edwardsbacteria bacterium]
MKAWELMSTDLPEWYRLSVAGTTLRIEVHPAILPELREYNARQGDVKSVGPYPLPPFTPMGSSNWGYGENIRQDGIDDGWVRFSVRCPAGNLEHDSHWSALYAAVASIKLVLDIVGHTEQAAESGPPQLFLVTGVFCQTDMGGASLIVLVSAYVARWIEKNPDISVLSVGRSIRLAYERMFGRRMPNEFRCWFRSPKYLHLVTLGNACSLDPNIHGISDHFTGYELYPHNMDSPLQSLSLLIGLGAFSDLIRSSA